nr:dihydroxy-acid dehydratase [Entomobacter blattae]
MGHVGPEAAIGGPLLPLIFLVLCKKIGKLTSFCTLPTLYFTKSIVFTISSAFTEAV